MLNIFRLLNSFSGFKLSLWNRSSEKAFLTSPLTPTNEGIKLLLSRSISFEQYQTLSTLLFHWAYSYDSKDWVRLSTILAPDLKIDYTIVHDLEHRFSGDPLLKTQHLLGACEYECVGKKTIMARQQLRAGHLRFEDESHKVETKRGHSHATNGFYFKKVWIKELGREEWRWAGFKPEVSWNEYEFETIFGGFECPKSLSYCSVLA